MPVAIPIGAKADQASFKSVADQVDKIFTELGGKIGKDLSGSLIDGFNSGESAARSSATKIVNAYDKVADATGKVKTIQEQLNAAQKSDNTVRIVRETERLESARRKESQAIRQTINDLKDYEQQAKTASSAFGSGFSSGFSRSRVGGYFSDLKAEAQSSGSLAGVVAGRAMGAGITAGLAAATGGVVAVIGGIGYALTKGFARYEAIDAAKHRLDNLNKTLAATGKAEVDVKSVMDTVNDVVQGTPFSLDAAFSLSTRALSSNTGDLQRFMSVVADAARFSGDGLDNIGDAFLKVANTGKVSMDLMSNELRNLPVLPWLQQQLGVTGAELEKMISKGKVGLEDLMRAVETNASGFAKSAGDTLEGSISNMQTAVARTGAKLLGALFGQPTDDANTLKDAVTVLTGRIDELGKWVDDHQGDIKRLFDDGVSAAQAIGGALSFVVDHLGMVAVGAGTVVGAFVVWKSISGVAALIDSLATINTALGVTLPASATTGAARIAAAFSPLLATLSPIIALLGSGKLIHDMIAADRDAKATNDAFQAQDRAFLDGFGLNQPDVPYQSPLGIDAPELKPAPVAAPGSTGGFLFGDNGGADLLPSDGSGAAGDGWMFGGGDGAVVITGPPPPAPPSAPAVIGADTAPLVPGPSGSPILAPPGLSDGEDGKGGKGAKGTTPPPHFDPSQWSLAANPVAGTSLGPTDDTSILNARTRVEEARLRLLELDSKENVAQSTLVSAKNNVLQAERALRDAETKATEQHYKSLQKHTGELAQIGAKIDQDFGISKGLPGIAENLTKFVANLALAPALGALSVIAGAGGAGGGVGGMMVGGGMGGGNVAAMMGLAQSASGRTKYGPASDLANGLADCSGSISDLVEMLQTGQSTPGRLFTTTDFATDAGAARHGFRPGYKPGALNVGVNPYPGQSGHMAATLPNGVNFEGGGGTGGGAQYGGSAAGALDQQFAKQFYMPVGPSASAMPYGAISPGVSGGYGGGHGYMPSAGAVIGGDGAALPGLVPGAGQGLATAAIGAGPGGVPIPAPVGIAAAGGGGGAGMAPVGLSPSAGAGGEGFQGLGGLPMEALMTAASAIPIPGAGIAAQKGMQLINRGIGFGGQLAGIGVSGLLNTFLPRESALADVGNSWFGRLASGFAGARPAGKNMAGKSTLPNPEDARQKPQGAAPAQGGNTINNEITLNNNGATEDAQGQDLTHHLNQQYAPVKR